jgi:hypothetical protein
MKEIDRRLDQKLKIILDKLNEKNDHENGNSNDWKDIEKYKIGADVY